MKIKTIKGIDEETWRNFKATAAKNNLRMSLLLKIMISEFEKNSSIFWKNILEGDRNLSDEEADKMSKIALELRKERGFRE